MSATPTAHFAGVLLPGMKLPEPLGMLFDWIEERGLVFERNGVAVGTAVFGGRDQRWLDRYGAPRRHVHRVLC